MKNGKENKVLCSANNISLKIPKIELFDGKQLIIKRQSTNTLTGNLFLFASQLFPT